MSELRKLGVLNYILENNNSNEGKAYRLASELGVAVAEHRFLHAYEEYIFLGYDLKEWRESGLPLAKQERLRQGQRTHKAIVKAAKELYKKNPNLMRNDTATAREIQNLNIPELTKSNGQPLSIDTITKHLRKWRKENR